MTVKVICCVSIFTVMADEKAGTIGQTAEGEIHVDGTQIYGWSTSEAFNIRFDGCRFEMQPQ